MTIKGARSTTLCGLTIILVTALPALGRGAEPGAEEGPAGGASPAASTAENGGLEEIVVTAQRRSESLQNAPIAIAVLTSENLTRAGVTDLEEMSRLTPSLQNGRAGGPFALFFLRGVGSFAANSLTDAAIAVNLDDVPLARQYSTGGQFYDLERVEVLKGPQGTLYGRNATGGAINIIPQHPTFENSVEAGATFSNFHGVQTNGALNASLTDQSAARLSFQTVRHDGYLTDGEQDEDSQAARLQYRVDPAGGLSLVASADYFHQGGRGGGNVLLDGGSTASDRIGLTDPRAQAYYQSIGRVAVSPQQLFIDGNYGGGKVTLTWNNDLGDLVVIPAYRVAAYHSVAISGPLLIDAERDHQQSFESRFAFKEMQGVRLIVGGFYLEDNVRGRFEVDNLAPNRTLPASGNTQDFRQITRTEAGFADATYSIVDALRLIGGVRYTHDLKSLDGSLTTYATFVPALPIDQSRTWNSTDWRAGMQWDVSQASMLYATVSTGFHSGGFFFTHDNPTYQPEKLKAYTVGSKNRFFDNRLHANLEAFYWDYTNQQLSGVSSDSSGSTIFATVNAASSKIRGAELELDYLVATHTRLGLQGQFLDSYLNTFAFVQPFPVSALSACHSTFVSPGHFNVSCSGLPPPQSPRWTFTSQIEQTLPLASGATLVANLQGHYQTSSWMAFNYLPTDWQGGYTSGDFSLTYNAPENKWSTAAFVNNINDKAIKNSTNHPNVDSAFLRAPRTYGVRFAVHF